MSPSADLFTQINNAVLDLQASQLQTYERPLKRLGHLLGHAELEDANRRLVEGLDLQSFLDESANSAGGMVGSATLAWPDDQREALGLTWLLLRELGENPDKTFDFSHRYFYAGSKIIAGIHAMVRQLVIPFVRDYKAYVMSVGEAKPVSTTTPRSDNIFIVHGHDGEARETVARFIERLGFKPIILHEQANRGRTIIEKVEANSDVGFAIVLLTHDDEGRVTGSSDFEPRARQNVLLELGYFIGRLGRENVCALKRGQVEIPSDFAGVVWEAMGPDGGWKQAIGRELVAAGYTVDWNKVHS